MHSFQQIVLPYALAFVILSGQQGAHAVINYAAGFPCNLISTGVLTVSDGGRSFPRLTSIGVNNTLCYLEMTTDAAVSRASSAYTEILFEDGTFNFVATFTYRIFGTGAGIGDGLAFVLHRSSQGKNALGGSGGFLGIYGPNVTQPALAVELDTFRNSELGDLNDIEIHVRTTRGANATNLANVATTNIRTTTIDERRTVEIRHQNNQLQVFLNGALLVTTPSGLSTLFNGGSRAFVGFTAATNTQGDLHDIFNWTMTNVRSLNEPGSPTITCLIPIPILGPLLCFILELIF